VDEDRVTDLRGHRATLTSSVPFAVATSASSSSSNASTVTGIAWSEQVMQTSS
jgi:hypothetical protein